MDALMQKKSTEAKQHIVDAEKSLKTSLFKRKPDYESAAISYNSAATCYKIVKDLNKAIECFKKSAECYNDNNSLYNAAKQYEQVGFMANEAKNYALTAESIEKASDLMLTAGVRDSAGIILDRAANMIKINDPANALKLYKKALHVAEVEEKYHEMIMLYENGLTTALRISDYSTAVELVNGSLTVLDRIGSSEQITKAILTVVIIHLSRDDWASARTYLDSMKNKYDGAFSRVEELLEIYDEKDDEKMKSLLKNYLTYAVDNEALKLANKIPKTEEWLKHTQEAIAKPKVNPVAKPAQIETTNKQAEPQHAGRSEADTPIPDSSCTLKTEAPPDEDDEEEFELR